jgi:DnaJ-class molecular chaperone
VLGTTLEVPTLEGGKADVKIPAGIQPDTVLRLRNGYFQPRLFILARCFG